MYTDPPCEGRVSNLPTIIAQKEGIAQDKAQNLYNEFRAALGRSPFYSVDAFLEHRPEYEQVGKCAIAAHLLRYERTRFLFEHWHNPSEVGTFQKILPNFRSDGHWYQYLFNKMVTNSHPFEDNKLSIITFNYDRSFEWYFYNSLQETLSSTKHKPAEIKKICIDSLSKMKIIHVYGSLGILPGFGPEAQQVPYNGIENSYSAGPVIRAADSIILMREGRDESALFQEAHKCLQDPEIRVFFLGFSFDETNMKRLFPRRIPVEIGRHCFGTALGVDHNCRRNNRQMGLITMGSDIPKEDEFNKGFPAIKIYPYLHERSQSTLE